MNTELVDICEKVEIDKDLEYFGEEVSVIWIKGIVLDKHIEHVYGIKFESQAENEKAYESVICYEVDGEMGYDQDDLNFWIKNGYSDVYDITGAIFNDMCRRDIIEAGTYIVDHK